MALKRAFDRAARIATLILVLAALADAAQWLRASLDNERIRTASIEEVPRAQPELQFARAHALAAQGDAHRALAQYKRVAGSSVPELAEAALFNIGNLYMRLAAEQNSKEDEARAIPLVELAKRSYREVLRTNPAHWDAKYNLERSLRLAPDTADEDVASLPPPPARERAATTMRGLTLGLP